MQAHQPDAIVTTYPLYQAPLAALFALTRHYIPVLTVVTDLGTVHGLWFNDDVDRCLVPTQSVLQKALESGLAPDRVEVTGLPVNPALAHEVDKAALRSRLGWGQDATVALVAGSARVTKLEPAVDVLDHCGWPLELALVAGGDKALEGRWAARAWHQPADVYGYTDDMPSLMLAADLIVCKAGGLIVSEALAAGLPLLLVQALPGQEEGNATYVTEGGAGVVAKDPLETLTTVCHWLENGAAGLAVRAARARRLGATAGSLSRGGAGVGGSAARCCAPRSSRRSPAPTIAANPAPQLRLQSRRAKMQARYVHTNLIARDWRALAAWYVTVFGCTVVPPERDYMGPELEAGSGVAGAHLQGVHLRLPGYDDRGADSRSLQL